MAAVFKVSFDPVTAYYRLTSKDRPTPPADPTTDDHWELAYTIQGANEIDGGLGVVQGSPYDWETVLARDAEHAINEVREALIGADPVMHDNEDAPTLWEASYTTDIVVYRVELVSVLTIE
jgi:hypothetical protein